MKNIKRLLVAFLAAMTIMPLISACSDDDDLKEIFTGKKWKMSYIFNENNYKVPADLWEGDSSRRDASLTSRDTEGNYTIVFTGAEISGSFHGAVSGRTVNSQFTGQWDANPRTHELNISELSWTGTETDIMAKSFKQGLENAFKFSGDSNNLYIYYHPNDATTLVIGLIHQR